MKMKYEEITKHWVTIEAAAKYLGVSQDTLRRWEKKGKFTPRRTLGGHRRYLRRQLEEVLKLPVPPITGAKSISYEKQKYQLISTKIPIPPTTPISRHQFITINSNKYQRITNILKSFLPTLLIAIAILSLLLGSYLLLLAAKTPQRSTEPQFVSPLPQTTTLQSP